MVDSTQQVGIKFFKTGGRRDQLAHALGRRDKAVQMGATSNLI